MFQMKLRRQNTRFMLYNFSRQSCRLRYNVEKYSTARQVTDDNTRHTHFMLDNEGYKHTLSIRNTYWFSTTTMVE
jgi:hypothetical protein